MASTGSRQILVQAKALLPQLLCLQIALLLLLVPSSSQYPLQMPQPDSSSESESNDAGAVLSLSQSSLSLRPDWLQQKVRPDSEWQKKMEMLLGSTSLLGKSAEQEAIQEATRNMAARKNGPNDSFRAAIKQILLGIH